MDKATLLDWYKQMVLIRRFEQKCAELYQLGKIGGFLHLYIGQEAVAVGSIGARREQDHVITAYRDHAHALLVGTDGLPRRCRVFRSSGLPDTDARTCDLAMARFRFEPARNARGQPIEAEYGWEQRFRRAD